MTKRAFNRFDPFMPIKVETNDVKFDVFENANNIKTLNDFEGISLNEGLKFKTPEIIRGFVVIISKVAIGTDNDLGKKLLEDFIDTLSNSFELPQYMIFTNEAVLLLKNSNVINSVGRLKKYGVKNLVSLESLSYFKNNIDSNLLVKATSKEINDKILLSKKLINM